MNPPVDQGQAVIDAVIRSGAIERMIEEGDSKIFVWKANAVEQIEAALVEARLEVTRIPEHGCSDCGAEIEKIDGEWHCHRCNAMLNSPGFKARYTKKA